MTELEKVLRDDPRLPKLFDDPPDEVMRFILDYGIFGMIGGKGSAKRFRGIIDGHHGSGEGYRRHNGDPGILVHFSANVHPMALIEPPALIGPNCEVRAFSVIRGGTWLVEDCVVGSFCEIKNTLMLQGARASHLNYVGDSILGAGVNLGAGMKLSNFRHDGGLISVRAQLDTDDPIETGLTKFGAILGDGVKVGCNSSLAPGTIIGANALVYEATHLPSGVYEGDRVYYYHRDLTAHDR